VRPGCARGGAGRPTGRLSAVEAFIVRLWVPRDDSVPEQQLCGVVEHVASGTERTFVNEDELLVLLRAPTQVAAAAKQVGGTPWGGEEP
jgi:hypothetical protein